MHREGQELLLGYMQAGPRFAVCELFDPEEYPGVGEGKGREGKCFPIEEVCWGDPSRVMGRGAIDVEGCINCRLPIDCAIRFVTICVFDRLDHHRFKGPDKALCPSI